MTLQELKEKAAALSLNDRLELVDSIIQSLKESARNRSWKFLEPRAESWRKQLYLRGSRLRASSLCSDMVTNNMTPEESAEDWDLPLAAIVEAMEYCQLNKDLIAAEADEERRSLDEPGASLTPHTTVS
ncbi:MAG: hypothetical protein WA949_21125 [Phormidesmis sp.]